MKKNTTTEEKVVRNTTNFLLSGSTNPSLRAQKITTTIKVVRKIHPNTGNPGKILSQSILKEDIEDLTFPLSEVTPEQLAEYRKTGTPGFVLRMAEKFYFSIIPQEVSVDRLCHTHLCANCHRLSAASDKMGGCAKVRGRATGIEEYPFITYGYETFNTKDDSFVVGSCKQYEKPLPQKKFSSSEIYNMRLGLAQYVWPDVRTISEARERTGKGKW